MVPTAAGRTGGAAMPARLVSFLVATLLLAEVAAAGILVLNDGRYVRFVGELRHTEPAVIVDCSHGNSEKRAERQVAVMDDLCQQLRQGQRALRGVMLESHLHGGAQQLKPDQPLTYGQSITDACLSLADTVPLLEALADAMRQSGRAQ